MISISSIPIFTFIKWALMVIFGTGILYFTWDIVKTYQEKEKLEIKVSQLNSVIRDKNSRIVFLEKDIQNREKLLSEANKKRIELERKMNETLENLPDDSKDQAPESIKELIRRLSEEK